MAIVKQQCGDVALRCEHHFTDAVPWYMCRTPAVIALITAALSAFPAVAVNYDFGTVTAGFSITASEQGRTINNSTFGTTGGAVYERGAFRDTTYDNFDLASLVGTTISGDVNLNFIVDSTFGGVINNGVVGTANTSWTYSNGGAVPGYTLISGATGPNATYSNGQTATWTIPQATFQVFVDNPGSFYGLAVTAGAGSQAHFSGVGTLTGTQSGVAIKVTGGTDWSAASWTQGTKTLAISGANTVTGGNITMLGSTTLSVTDSATLGGGSFSGSIANGGQLAISTSANQTLTGGISGAGSLVKSGGGLLTLSGSNPFSGGITISGGTLAAVRNTLGTGAVVIDNGGTLQANDQWVFGGANAWNVNTLTTASLTIKSGGALVFDATQGYANGITNLYLEGGSISGGDNGSGFGVMFLYNGNEQITARGGTTSTIASTVALTGSTNSITVEPASVLEITGRLKNSGLFGAGGFVKSGGGTLVLSAANDYSGATSISGGILQVGNGGTSGSLGSGAVTVASGATLAFDRSDDVTFANAISGSGGITKLGAGTLSLSARSNLTGAITVSSGSLQLADGDWVTGSPWDGNGMTGAITVGPGAVLSTSAGVTEIKNGLSLNGGTVSSRGLANGGTWGNLVLSSNVAAGGTATSTITSEIDLNGSRTFTVDAGSTLNATGNVTSWYSAGGITKAGAGTLVLQGANSYSGGTTINGGTVSISAASADNEGYTSLGTGDVTINGGGTLVSVGNWSTGNEWNSGNVGKITVNNGGAWTINTLGNTVRNGLELNGGTINGTGASRDWGGLYLRSTYLTASGNATSTVAVNTALNGQTTFTVDAGSQLNYSGGIQNKIDANGGITKAGEGTLLLSGSNTYSGATQVNAGTLAVNGSLGATAVTVASGGTLGGSGSIAGPVNVLGTLSPGNSPGVITLGSLVLGGTSTTLIEIAGTARGTQYDGVDITTSSGLTYGGILSLDFTALGFSAVADNTTFDIFSFGGSPLGNFSSVTSTGIYSGTWNSQGGGVFKLDASNGQTLTFSQATGDIIVVPEPGTLALAVLGFTMGGWSLVRCRRIAAIASRI